MGHHTMRLSLVGAGMVLALAACSPGSLPSTPGAMTPSAAPSAPTGELEATEPASEAAPAALSIPDCEALLPLALARLSFGDATQFLDETEPTVYPPRFQSPEVNDAIGDLTLGRACWWGIPSSDGAFSLLVGEIDAATRDSIDAALTAQSFSSTTMGTLTIRQNSRDGEASVEAETHLFTANVWIVVDEGSLETSESIARSALDALRTANPTLGL